MKKKITKDYWNFSKTFCSETLNTIAATEPNSLLMIDRWKENLPFHILHTLSVLAGIWIAFYIFFLVYYLWVCLCFYFTIYIFFYYFVIYYKTIICSLLCIASWEIKLNWNKIKQEQENIKRMNDTQAKWYALLPLISSSSLSAPPPLLRYCHHHHQYHHHQHCHYLYQYSSLS